MDFNLYDVVKIKPDILIDGIPSGTIGTIVLIHESPSVAYEVEFVDAQGRTVDTVAIVPENLEKYTG